MEHQKRHYLPMRKREFVSPQRAIMLHNNRSYMTSSDICIRCTTYADSDNMRGAARPKLYEDRRLVRYRTVAYWYRSWVLIQPGWSELGGIDLNQFDFDEPRSEEQRSLEQRLEEPSLDGQRPKAAERLLTPAPIPSSTQPNEVVYAVVAIELKRVKARRPRPRHWLDQRGLSLSRARRQLLSQHICGRVVR